MAISSTYGTMQRQIADELGDNQALLSPLSDSALSLSPIQNAIQSAIAKWERKRFYFNELLIQTPLSGSYSWQTSNGQEYYGDSTSPQAWSSPAFSTVAYIETMWVLVNSNRYLISLRTSPYLTGVSVNPAVVGYPTNASYSAEMLKFYPIPDGTYPLGIIGTKRFTALSADTDTNIWMQDAFDLIRCEAKMVLARDVLHDPEEYKAAQIAAHGDPSTPGDRGYLGALKGETTQRIGRGKMIPTYF